MRRLSRRRMARIVSTRSAFDPARVAYLAKAGVLAQLVATPTPSPQWPYDNRAERVEDSAATPLVQTIIRAILAADERWAATRPADPKENR